MISQMKPFERWSWVAMIAGLCAYIVYVEVLTPRPYKDVIREHVEIDDDRLYIVWTFVKLECDIQRFDVIGGINNVTKVVKWRDEDGLTIDETRTVGRQTLRMSFPIESFDWIEFRTKHDCNGQTVFKLFDRMNIVDIPED